MLSPEGHQARARELSAADGQPALPNMVSLAVASWLPEGWNHAAVATRGERRTGIFMFPNGLLVLRFDADADDVQTSVLRLREISTIEMSHHSQWYFEYQMGGAESAGLWANDMYPAEATIELRRQVLDLGDKIELPLPGRERKYPGDWDLVLDLRAKLLGVDQAQ